jgi:hypothetical protein
MASGLQVRHNPKSKVPFKELGPMRHQPLVARKRLNDVRALVADMPALAYPIHSAGELLEMLGGKSRVIDIFGVPMYASRLIKGMPAHYFPIVSPDNFAEKIAELLNISRRTVVLVKELGRIRPHLPDLPFPLHGVDDVLKAFASVDSLPASSPRLPQGHQTIVSQSEIRTWIIDNMTPDLFPIHTEEELYEKALRLVPQTRHTKRG